MLRAAGSGQAEMRVDRLPRTVYLSLPILESQGQVKQTLLVGSVLLPLLDSQGQVKQTLLVGSVGSVQPAAVQLLTHCAVVVVPLAKNVWVVALREVEGVPCRESVG